MKFQKTSFLIALGLATALPAWCRADGPLVLHPPPGGQPNIPNGAIVDEQDSRAVLAERFNDLAMTFGRGARPSAASLKQRAILLAAAVDLNPTEPRYSRSLAQTQTVLGDFDGAIKAWGSYLKCPDFQQDQVAQVALINLHLAQLQDNESKIKYLKALMGLEGLDVHVKAKLAAMAVPLLDQRSHEEAMAMLATARKFYPLPEVTLLEWQMLPKEATEAQRFTALMNMMRSNPLQPEAMERIADKLSQLGLTEDALIWYAALMDVHAANGTGPSKDSIINYMLERYRSGETTLAADGLDEMLGKFPEDADLWFLRLTIQRADESPLLLEQAQQSFLRRLNGICGRIVPEKAKDAERVVAAKRPATQPATREATTQQASAESPATQPAGQTLAKAAKPPATQPATMIVIEHTAIPLADAVARVGQASDPELKDALAAALADLGWFEAYFNHNAERADIWVKALAQLTPADNVVLRRLQGWTLLAAGNLDSASAILSPQADSDALSGLGMYKIADRQNKDQQAEKIGDKLITQPHTGVLGAIIWQATKGHGLKPLTPPPELETVRTELGNFPKEWLDVVHKPWKFYSIHASPLKVGHKIGEPFLYTFAVQNQTKADLAIGDLGLVKPFMVFDAQIRGEQIQNFPAMNIERIMGPLVLGAGQTLQQTCRLDEAELSDQLHTKPGLMLIVNADLMSNPIPGPDGNFHFQAGGFARYFNTMFTRTPQSLSLDGERRALVAELNPDPNAPAKGSPTVKFEDLELLASYVQQYSTPTATPNEHSFALEFTNLIDKSRGDATSRVGDWASYVLSLLLVGPDEEKTIEGMLASKDWEARLLAQSSSRLLSLDKQKEIAARMAKDGNDLVRSFAQATLQIQAAIPTTAPATQPAANAN